ncbi:MAG: tRNA glutamyl-Q(34) synthetase GluQRS [Hyphomicrobiaceae bacterium]|nr:tRNA glutamyl-Q(34) synthetase GluQRS [Hyphomicrobiaceae bacterium]
MPSPILRFAPSPNGFLHLGHAYSALQTFEWSKALGGRFLLRIEDIDLERSKPEFTKAIFEDLAWLGLAWEEPVMRQSERFDAYRAAAESLIGMRWAYPCFCSRTHIAESATSTDPDGAPLYPGTCRNLSQAEITRRLAAGDPVQYRLDMARLVEKVGVLTFSQSGPAPMDRPQIRYADPARWGDAVIVRKGTPTSYHLSVVIDDAAQGITHVTRGRDMEAATDIHVLLQFLLGLPQPIYTFHRLILDDDGKKLSKSRRSMSIRALREQGWTPDDVRGAVGLTSRN